MNDPENALSRRQIEAQNWSEENRTESKAVSAVFQQIRKGLVINEQGIWCFYFPGKATVLNEADQQSLIQKLFQQAKIDQPAEEFYLSEFTNGGAQPLSKNRTPHQLLKKYYYLIPKETLV